jgi:hypothetical protein
MKVEPAHVAPATMKVYVMTDFAMLFSNQFGIAMGCL